MMVAGPEHLSPLPAPGSEMMANPSHHSFFPRLDSELCRALGYVRSPQPGPQHSAKFRASFRNGLMTKMTTATYESVLGNTCFLRWGEMSL